MVKSTEEDKIQDENAEEVQKSIEIVRMDTPTIEYTQPSDGDDSDENSQKSLKVLVGIADCIYCLVTSNWIWHG